MKNVLPLLVLLFAGFSARSQTYSASHPACGIMYSFVCQVMSDKSINVTIKKDDNIKVEFNIKTDDYSVFGHAVKEKVLTIEPACSDSGKNALQNFGNNLYFRILAANTDAKEPVHKAATLSVKKWLKLLQKDDHNKEPVPSKDSFFVKRVQVEIIDGFIENIKVEVTSCDSSAGVIYFTNLYSIGISSVTNIKDFESVNLYEFRTSPYYQGKPDSAHKKFFIKMADLINYDYELDQNRRDYSPKNMKFDINGGESIVLEKDETKKLFQAVIYTDFIGLNDDKPNGLVQTEISKKININTVQYLPGRNWVYKSFFKSWGYLQYISPVVTFSKLEQHNKWLNLGNLDSIRMNPGPNDTTRLNKSLHRYATAIDVLQYQSFSGGLDLNLLYVSNHDLKYNFYLNFGVRVGITPVRDSLTRTENNTLITTGLVNQYNLNTVHLYPQILITFLPEERFNFSFSDKLSYLRALNHRIQLLGFGKKDQEEFMVKKNAWINTMEMQIALQVNENSKLFGRLKLNYELNQAQGHFLQVQVGYSLYVLGNK